jgi:hypothetical protein
MAHPGKSTTAETGGHGTVQHLPQRLRRLEAVPFRNGQPPCVHLLGKELRQPDLAKHGRGFPKQPAQLRDHDRLRLVHLQILLNEFAERHRSAAPCGTQPLDHLLKRLLCPSATGEPTDLRPHRPATLEPIAVRPKCLAVRALRFQLEHLTLLHHHRTSSIDDRIEESQPQDTRGDDHLSQREASSASTYAVAVSRHCCYRPVQAVRRWTSQTVPPIRSRESASSQPPSMSWNGQKRLAG